MKGVVFDTSIWIEYLRGNSGCFNVCQELLENGRVFGIELIFWCFIIWDLSKNLTSFKVPVAFSINYSRLDE